MACLTEFQCAVYADGELGAREAHETSEHLKTCGTCRTLVATMREESRVLVECFQTNDFIEFELEDETLSAPQAHNLGVVRFAALVLAMSVLLRPVMAVIEEMGLFEDLNWFAITGAYIVPAAVSFVDSILRNASWIALSAIVLLGFVLFSRRSMVTSSILSVLALLTVFSSSSYALDVRRGSQPVTVPPGETIDDTLVVAGDSVTIDGTVTGDLVAFVREVTIRGRVKGNVIAFARRVELEQGTVEGSVIGLAQSVQTRGQVAHNIYAFAQTAEVGREARVDENLTVFAAESDIQGTIGKDAFARVGSVSVAAPARIGGGFTAKVDRADNVRIGPGVMIGGKTDIQTPKVMPSKYSTLSFYVWQIIWLTAAFLTGLVLFWILPGIARGSLDGTRELFTSAGVGFLALVATPIASLLAAITLIGLPLGVIVFLGWIVAAYLAKIVVAGFLGRSLLQNDSTALMLLTGLLPIFVAINLPYIGGLINFFLVVLGLGMLVIRAFRMPQSILTSQALSR